MSYPIFPFSSVDNLELLDLFAENEFLPSSAYEDLYFNPLNSSDRYNYETDPDRANLIGLMNHYSLCSKFYDLTSSRQNLKFSSNSLNVVSCNIRSLSKNCDEFLSDIDELDFEVIALCETWLSNDTEQLFSKVGNYNGIFKNRCFRGGGVGFLIKNPIKFELVEEISYTDSISESIFIRLEHNLKDFVLGCIYRPPNSSKEAFIDRLTLILDYYQQNLKDSILYIFGDLNLDLFCEAECMIVQNLVNQFYSYDLCPMIRRATRVTKTTAKLIDHIWSNDPNIQNSGIIRSRVTDHFPVFVTRKSEAQVRDSHETVSYRNFSTSNKQKFRDALSRTNWTNVLECDNVESMYNSFSDTMTSLFIECFPMCTRRKKTLDIDKPFITDEIKCLIKEKHKITKLYLKKPITFAAQYTRIRNEVTLAVKNAKKNYVQNLFSSYERDPQKMWGVIDEILGRSAKDSTIVKSLKIENEVISDLPKIVNAFNEFFANIGSDLNANFPETSNFSNFLVTRPNSEFKFRPVHVNEVRKIIAGMRRHGGNFDNNIPTFIFKDFSDQLVEIVAAVCNRSIMTGIFPSRLAIAKVTCLFKNGDPNDVSNYRPISILPSFSKILEKVVISQFSNYLNSNHIITNCQFGFRSGRSTEHAVHTLVKDIHDSFNMNNFVLCIFLDIKKAFDSLDRHILIQKLKFYGVRGIECNWFQSYLSNRKQYTKIGNTSSDTLPVKFGVPQGGVLSSLLFLIFINDIINCSLYSDCVLYADDTSLYVSSPMIGDLFDKAQRALLNFKSWFDENKLTLNTSKTNYIIFHRLQKRIPTINRDLCLNNSKLNRVFNTRFLGLVIDSNLSWSDHIRNLSKKLFKYVPIVYRIRNFCTRRALSLVYNCLIYSNIIYCNSVWGPSKKVATHPLVIVHKKIIRAIAGVGQLQPTAGIFQELRILNFDNINVYMSGIFVYKCLDSTDFHDWFQFEDNAYPTRRNDSRYLRIPRTNNVHSEQMISYRGAKIWNSIPNDICENSYDRFKFLFKSFLLTQQ